MKSNFAHRIPDIQFEVIKNPETAADKIYLGLFLAICLFIAFMFGNLLFSIMVIILCVFIMLSRTSNTSNTECVIAKEGVGFEKQFYNWETLRNFAIVENTIDEGKFYLRLSFKSYLNQHVYIPLGANVQKEKIHDIISARLDENPNPKLSIAEMLMLRFFKW